MHHNEPTKRAAAFDSSVPSLYGGTNNEATVATVTAASAGSANQTDYSEIDRRRNRRGANQALIHLLGQRTIARAAAPAAAGLLVLFVAVVLYYSAIGSLHSYQEYLKESEMLRSAPPFPAAGSSATKMPVPMTTTTVAETKNLTQKKRFDAANGAGSLSTKNSGNEYNGSNDAVAARPGITKPPRPLAWEEATARSNKTAQPLAVEVVVEEEDEDDEDWWKRTLADLDQDYYNQYYPANPDMPSIALDAGFDNMTSVMDLTNQLWSILYAIMTITDMQIVDAQNKTGSPNDKNDSQQELHYYQVLLPSLYFQDIFGGGQLVPFERVFDVDHWNSFVPQLPRLVSHNATLHYQYNATSRNMIQQASAPYTHPRALETLSLWHLFLGYFEYMKQFTAGNRSQHPADKLLLEGAMRPHPLVRKFIGRIFSRYKLVRSNATNGQDNHLEQEVAADYMALHPRMEQNFICYPWSSRMKAVGIRNLTVLFNKIEQHWVEPPVPIVFIAINRLQLEDEDISMYTGKPTPSLEHCDKERKDNLDALNWVVKHGLWGGRVKVVERPPLAGTPFSDRLSIFGAYIDSEILQDAKIFVGRPRSTFSVAAIEKRKVAGKLENYFYDLGGEIVEESAATHLKLTG